MKRLSPALLLLVAASFVAGFFTHAVYRKWTSPPAENQGYPVTYTPRPPPAETRVEPPLVPAREVEKLRALAGTQARVRGRVYRVGFSAKSNTYFLNFGPSRSAFTAVIFASALEAFEKKNIEPKRYEGREIELTGVIKDHPQYGLEMVLEDPAQIKVLD